MQQRNFEHGRNQVIEILPAKLRIEIFAGDDLALFGHANAGCDRARRLRQNRLVARAAAASD